jgi:hypothetical protein
LEKSTEEKQDVDNSITFPPITEDLGEKQKSHTFIPEKNVTEENLEAEALIQSETERLHIPCNQTVTGCNQEEKNVTEEVEAVVDTPQLVEEATREEWQVGELVVVDGTDLPSSLARFYGQQGIVEEVKVSSCLVRFDGEEVMHIPFRGLRQVIQ